MNGYYYGQYFANLTKAEADLEKRLRKEQRVKPENTERRVKVPPYIFEGLTAVRNVGTTNMFDVKVVKIQAVALGYSETADWIDTNKLTYIDGIFRGFEPKLND